MAVIAGAVVILIGIILGLIEVELPLSMGQKLDNLYKKEPMIVHEEGSVGVESSTFWDWRVNTNKWDLLESYEKTTLAYELKHNRYVVKLDPIMESHLVYNAHLRTHIGEVDGIYSGQVLDGVPHGNGRYVNDWGEIWEG